MSLRGEGREKSVYGGEWMFRRGKGVRGEGLYKRDMVRGMGEEKMVRVVGKVVVVVDRSQIGEGGGMVFRGGDEMDMVMRGKNGKGEMVEEVEGEGVRIVGV